MGAPNRTDTLLQVTKFKIERWFFNNTPVGSYDREIVVHPGAVVILPLLSANDIVMIHNFRPAVGQELIELPAGTLESGENPAESAARELEEETGYRAGSIEPLCQFYTTPGICTEHMYAFVGRDLEKTAQKLDDTEQIRTEVFTWNIALDMISTGKIVDGKTIATLATYHLQQKG